MSIAREFGERINALRWEDIDEVARRKAKTAIVDALGCTLAGAPEPCARVAGRALGSFPVPGPCVVIGTDTRTGPCEAAFMNGTASHALDFDDCSNTVGGHPTAPILFAALALAEVHDASGRDLLLAYVAGFETMAKLARGVHFHHYRKGWHPTATLGVFGATAACARILGLDAERTAQALSHSASVAAGIKANFGTMTKPLHVGYANRNGLFSAQLAAAGVSAGELAFEHQQGFLEVFNGAGTYDVGRFFDVWADPLDIVDPGVAIKAYPCCGSTHPAIDAALALRAEFELRPEDIAAIHSRTHERRLQHTDRPRPNDALDAKFSVQYTIARAIVSGHVGLAHFHGECYREPEIRSIMDKVTVEAHQDDNHFGAYLEIRTSDGRALHKYIPTPLGRDDSNPMPLARLRAKFDECAAISVHREQADALWDAVWGLEEQGSLHGLSGLLAGARSAYPEALLTNPGEASPGGASVPYKQQAAE